MQGVPFLGKAAGEKRSYIYGARDRADDMFETSRAVHDGRYIYIRHFMPHLPYLQGGRIFGNQKESLAELRRARDAGDLDDLTGQIFVPRKPIEEFYDLASDPYEIDNVVGDPQYAQRIDEMRSELKRWILEHRDTGFLTESEYTRRARKAGISIYEMVRDSKLYDLPSVLASAWSGKGRESEDVGVIYWEIVRGDADIEQLRADLKHPNPSVAEAAAERICLAGDPVAGLPILETHIASRDLRLALEAARALFSIGELAGPSVAKIEEVRKNLEGEPGGRRRYRDFNYASFTGWALEGVLINCGAAETSDFE